MPDVGSAPRIVVAKPSGRLANQLFMFASLIAYAIDTGNRIYNPAFSEYGEFFVGTCRDPLCRVPRQRSLFSTGAAFAMMSRLGRLYFSLAKRMSSRFTVYRSGGFLTPLRDAIVAAKRDQSKILVLSEGRFHYGDNVLRYDSEIRDFLRPIKKHQLAVDEHLRVTRARCEVLIGVHIRRGDFREYEGGQYVRSDRDFAEAMQRTECLFPGKKVTFLVCSDEPVDPLRFPGLDTVSGPGHFVEDLYSLAGADFLIGNPKSSYSMWASYYGDVPFCALDEFPDEVSLDSFRVVDLERGH